MRFHLTVLLPESNVDFGCNSATNDRTFLSDSGTQPSANCRVELTMISFHWNTAGSAPTGLCSRNSWAIILVLYPPVHSSSIVRVYTLKFEPFLAIQIVTHIQTPFHVGKPRWSRGRRGRLWLVGLVMTHHTLPYLSCERSAVTLHQTRQ